MARGWFGGSTDDFVYTTGAGGTVLVRQRTVTFWDSETAGTQYTDLVYDGAAVSAIPAQPSGQVPRFQGPNNDTVRSMWMDAGGTRVLLYALGTIAEEAAAGAAAALKKTSNLSDLTSPSTARGSLGLGTAATHAHTDYETAGAAATERDRALAVEAAKADLVGGKVPTSQIASISTHETVAVANRAAMLALTSAQIQPGDVAVIGTTGAAADRGLWLLNAADPSVIGSWVKLDLQTGVTSVQGQTGTIVLAAADVGATPAAHAGDTNNPHSVTKSQVGLGNAANLSPSGLAADAAFVAAFGPGSDLWLKLIAQDFGFVFTAITTLDATTGLPTAGPIKWPDGRTGAFAGTVDANYYTGFTATWVNGGTTKTVTVTGITYDTTNGLPLGPTGLAVA